MHLKLPAADRTLRVRYRLEEEARQLECSACSKFIRSKNDAGPRALF